MEADAKASRHIGALVCSAEAYEFWETAGYELLSLLKVHVVNPNFRLSK